MTKSKSNIRDLGLMAFLFILWKLTFLFFQHPSFFFVPFSAAEELYRGLVAKELLEGLKMPFYEYRPDSYNGGFFVISLLASFFFKFFGNSLLAFKMTPLFWSLMTLIIWYRWIQLFWHPRIAFCFGLLFTFAPLTFSRYSLTGMGHHMETMLFTGMLLYLFFKIRSQSKPRLFDLVLVSLVAGVGLWFNYVFGVTLVALFVFILFDPESKKKLIKSLPVLLLFFLLGFSPWILSRTLLHIDGLSVHDQSLFSFFKIPQLNSWLLLGGYDQFVGARILFSWIPSSPVILFGKGLNLIYGSLLLLSLIVIVGFQRIRMVEKTINPALFFCIVYLFTFCAVFQVFQIQAVRLLIPAFPFLIALASCGLISLRYYNFPFARQAAKSLFLALFLVSLTSNAFALSRHFIGDIVKQKGFSYKTLGHAQDITLYYDETLVREIQKKTPQDAIDLKLELAQSWVERLDYDHFFDETEGVLAVPEWMQLYIDYSLGIALIDHFGDETVSYEYFEELKNQLPYKRYDQVLKGAFDEMSRNPIFDLSPFERPEVKSVSEDVKQHFIQAKAARLAEEQSGFLDFDALLLSLKNKGLSLPEEAQGNFFRGVGKYLFQRWTEKPFDLSLFDKTFELVPISLWEGAGIRFAEAQLWGHSQNITWMKKSFLSDQPNSYRNAFARGENQINELFEEK